MPGNPPMIQVENLTKRFGENVILENLNAEIHRGEVVSIIGPSGTGKSTFLRCLNLLEQPTSGTIRIDGENICASKRNTPRLRQKMGMVFQSFNLFSHLSVLENLTIGPMKLKRVLRGEAEKQAMELLSLVGLKDRAKFYPSQLSGGQKQRVAIARCMAMKPEIILFDEPTSALDPTMVSEVLAVIRRLALEGMTMAIVTHEMDFARDVSTKVFYMDQGIIYEQGIPKEVFEAPQKDLTRRFLHRIRSLDFLVQSRDFDLYALIGQIEAFCRKHFLSQKLNNDLRLAVEEFIVDALENRFPKDQQPWMELEISYSERDHTTRLLASDTAPQGNPFETLNEPDPEMKRLGLRLIQGKTKEIRYHFNDGKNVLEIRF